MTNEDIIKNYKEIFSGKNSEELVAWAIELIGAENIGLSTSLSAEDQILTDIIVKASKKVQIFTLDTGRLPQETYEVIAKTREKYGVNIELLYPDKEDLRNLTMEYGADLFYESVDKRKSCCYVRKVAPLRIRLESLKAWITGIRKEQSITRMSEEKVEVDEQFGLIKINPLIDWTEEQVWDYIKQNNIPYNKLYDKGYRSIGCAPCTRAVKKDEDVRAGRWWWESADKKECGIHVKNGKVVRKNESA